MCTDVCRFQVATGRQRHCIYADKFSYSTTNLHISPTLQVYVSDHCVVCCFQQTRESWQKVFYVAAAVYTFGAIAYCVLASGSVQPWALDSHAADTNVIELEQNGTDVLLNPEKHSASFIQNPVSASGRNDDVTADVLLQVNS